MQLFEEDKVHMKSAGGFLNEKPLVLGLPVPGLFINSLQAMQKAAMKDRIALVKHSIFKCNVTTAAKRDSKTVCENMLHFLCHQDYQAPLE
jgi:uncharacterized small protein (DUF1192 family)